MSDETTRYNMNTCTQKSVNSVNSALWVLFKKKNMTQAPSIGEMSIYSYDSFQIQFLWKRNSNL